MTTLVRQQLMKSVGSLAEERQRLEQEIEALSRGLPDEAAEIVRKADDLMAEHGEKIAELKARRDAIDTEFDVTARGARELAAQQYHDRLEANRVALVAEEEARLQAIADAEAATRALVDAINRAIASNARLGVLARELTPSGKAPMSLSANGLVDRFAGRLASTMMTIKNYPYRFGSNICIQWPSGANGLFPADRSWVDDEQRRYAADLQPLLETRKD